MAAKVESDNAGGKFGHMHLILKEKEYRIATKIPTATVGLLKKPPDVHPKFHLFKKDNSPSTRSYSSKPRQDRRSTHS
jgi:hypothetical protein